MVLRVVIVMTDHVRLIATLVLLAILIAIRVPLVVTVMIAHRVVSIVMLLVVLRVVIVMTDHVRLIVTHAFRVVTVMIVLADLIVIHDLRAVQLKNVQMKLKAALANVAQVAKCQHHPSVLVKIG